MSQFASGALLKSLSSDGYNFSSSNSFMTDSSFSDISDSDLLGETNKKVELCSHFTP